MTICTKTFEKIKATMRFVAQVFGNIVASFSAVPLGPLFHRTLETGKIVGLEARRENYDTEIELSNEACSELAWWKQNMKIFFEDLFIPKLDITIFTDANETSWGITEWNA